MSFSSLWMQGYTGKMRKRSQAATRDHLLCLYLFSSHGLFCLQFLFLLSVCLFVGLGLSSRPCFSPASRWGPDGLCLSWSGWELSGVEPPRNLGCRDLWIQLSAHSGVWTEGAGRAKSSPGWVEPWSGGEVGIVDYSSSPPASRTRDACTTSAPQLCTEGTALSNWNWFFFFPKNLFFPVITFPSFFILQHLCHCCIFSSSSLGSGGLIIIIAIPKLLLLQRSVLNSGLNYKGLHVLILVWIAKVRSFKQLNRHITAEA